jgi:hypothetical protein
MEEVEVAAQEEVVAAVEAGEEGVEVVADQEALKSRHRH